MSECVGPAPGMLQLKRMRERASRVDVAPLGTTTSATKPIRQTSLRNDICTGEANPFARRLLALSPNQGHAVPDGQLRDDYPIVRDEAVVHLADPLRPFGVVAPVKDTPPPEGVFEG